MVLSLGLFILHYWHRILQWTLLNVHESWDFSRLYGSNITIPSLLTTNSLDDSSLSLWYFPHTWVLAVLRSLKLSLYIYLWSFIPSRTQSYKLRMFCLCRLRALTPQLKESSGLLLGYLFLPHGLETFLKQWAEIIRELTSFTSHLVRITVLYWQL